MKKVGENIDVSLFPEDLQIKDSKYTVVYFYPRDNTPGCTIEACEFRDFNKDISLLGVNIIGVSADSDKSHVKFANNFKLNFKLISDVDKKIINDFGVLVEKSMFGRKYMGIERSTFVIDSTGKIINIWEKVSPLGHAKKVYEYLKELI